MALYSTIWCDERPGLHPDVTVLHRERDGRRGVFRAVRGLKAGDAILLNGALGARDLWFDMLLAIYLRVATPSVGVLISDATWHPRAVPLNSRAKLAFPLYAWFLRTLLRLTRGPHTHYGFLSTAEADIVTVEAGLRPGAARFTAFCSQLPLAMMPGLHEQIAREGAGADAHAIDAPTRFFAGGNSLRDYGTLAAAATGAGGRFTVATSNVVAGMPPQARVGPLSERDFFLSMMRSDVVIVPLLPVDGRSVGQQTYLNALALGKPLIVTDTLGVRDHLSADVHALVVPPGDAAAMRAAIDWMQDPAHREARDAMARAGQQLAAEMTFAHSADRLCRWLREIQTGAAAARAPATSTAATAVGDLPAVAATLSAYPAPGSPSPDHPPP